MLKLNRLFLVLMVFLRGLYTFIATFRINMYHPTTLFVFKALAARVQFQSWNSRQRKKNYVETVGQPRAQLQASFSKQATLTSFFEVSSAYWLLVGLKMATPSLVVRNQQVSHSISRPADQTVNHVPDTCRSTNWLMHSRARYSLSLLLLPRSICFVISRQIVRLLSLPEQQHLLQSLARVGGGSAGQSLPLENSFVL